jgi:phage terminase large subunit-like protein
MLAALAALAVLCVLKLAQPSAARAHLDYAAGLDFANASDVRRAVDAYAERHAPADDASQWRFCRETAASAVLFFPQNCRLTKGEYAGRPFVLSDWQALDIIAPAFGWKHAETGLRRYRRGTVWVPRKNGKTELMAGVALAHLLGDGEMGGEGYAVATKEEQSRIVFDAARRMVLFNDRLRDHVQVFKDSLWCEPLFASFKPLGGKAEGSHGKGPSFRIADELHEFRDDRLLQFLDQGTGARQQPFAWDISTAGLQQGYGWELWNVSRQIASGVITDDRSLVAIYAAGEDDDPFDPATWARANPNLGISLKLDFLRDQADLARRSGRHENDFRRYHLNQWTGQDDRWLRMDRWQACAADDETVAWRTQADHLRGRRCFAGVDLASVRDLCAAVYVFPPEGRDDRWAVLCRFWVPKDGLEDRVRHERVPYDRWVDESAVIATEGDVADHDAILRQIIADCETFDVQGVGFDPWNAHKMMIELNDFRADLAVKVQQSMGALSGPSKHLERLVMQGRLAHAHHPVLRWMADNAAIMSDHNGNIRPAKDKSTQKIDGIVALVIALAVAQGEDAETGLPNIEALA